MAELNVKEMFDSLREQALAAQTVHVRRTMEAVGYVRSAVSMAVKARISVSLSRETTTTVEAAPGNRAIDMIVDEFFKQREAKENAEKIAEEIKKVDRTFEDMIHEVNGIQRHRSVPLTPMVPQIDEPRDEIATYRDAPRAIVPVPPEPPSVWKRIVNYIRRLW